MKKASPKNSNFSFAGLSRAAALTAKPGKKAPTIPGKIDGPRDNARHRHLARPLLDQRQNGLSCAGQWQTCLSEKAPLLYIQVITP
jgi:hypothetical protein